MHAHRPVLGRLSDARSRCPVLAGAASVVLVALCGVGANAALWGRETDAFDYHKTFGLDAKRTDYPYKVTLIDSSAAGNVFHAGEQAEFTFQIENLTDAPLKAAGTVELIHYGGRSRPGEQWVPQFYRIAADSIMPLRVNLPAKGWRNVVISLKTRETKGGYALVVDLAGHGRRLLTNFISTFKADTKRVQFPKQSLENMPPEILRRLGVQAIRYAVAYIPSDDTKRHEERLAWLDEQFKAMHANHVTCAVEIGNGARGEAQPLGRGRPHLTEDAVMKSGKQDLAWLPKYDDDYQKFVYHLASTYGWPKGPVTGFMLWNEPWEGLSISGWGADMIRYRNLYKRMGDAVFRARKEAGVDVLVGGCDSSTNTWDKLFPDGTKTFLPYLDFCSIHYQGLSSPVLYPMWHNRTHYKGRVLVWDTESWVANTDDRFAGVVATNRAAGYDRSMGIRGGSVTTVLSHHRVAHDTIRTKDGPKKVRRRIKCWPVAAVVGAVQHFIDERNFKEILFKTGLPWVYVFDGLDGNADDGTVVVLGDIATLFGRKGTNALFRTVRCLDEVRSKRAMRRELASLPAASDKRAALTKKLRRRMAFTNATLTLDSAGGLFVLYDFYGNPVAAKGGRIVVPLNEKGFFLRADPKKKGSFARLVEALRRARIDGIEPVEIIAYDMPRPIAGKPVMRLRLTSMCNRPIEGELSLRLGKLKIEHPRSLRFAPRQRKWVEVCVTGGEAAASNIYPLRVTFAAGAAGTAEHEENMHVNWISRRTIRVDGKLDDWKGVLPQTICTAEAAERSFEEAMWLPFETFKPGRAGGFAAGYLAYDKDHFYFAAKIADDTAHAGAPRFAKRDDDADFYPQVCYSIAKRRGRRKATTQEGEKIKHVWPDGVRRYSYRRWPALPSSYGSVPFDNVLIGFNAIPLGEDGWMSHLPGRMPKFIWCKTTDYEYALNRVAEAYGGGTEVWRLLVPGMPVKHFYPRQPKHPKEGAVESARLRVVYQPGTRIVECALPWGEIPHVKQRLDAGRSVKFSFRVNHDTRGPTMELAAGRSAAEGISNAFRPDWEISYPNELEFGWEK